MSACSNQSRCLWFLISCIDLWLCATNNIILPFLILWIDLWLCVTNNIILPCWTWLFSTSYCYDRSMIKLTRLMLHICMHVSSYHIKFNNIMFHLIIVANQKVLRIKQVVKPSLFKLQVPFSTTKEESKSNPVTTYSIIYRCLNAFPKYLQLINN